MRSALALVLSLLAVACGRGGSDANARHFTLQGQVLAVAATRTEATIRHEEIPGFMTAMTMPYKVRDAKEFASVKPGDLITATLVVGENAAYLEQVRVVGSAPLDVASGGALPTAASGFELLPPGAPVPNIDFITQAGAHTDLAAFRGEALIVTFIYTSCPMPEFCPLMDTRFKEIQAKLKAQQNVQKAHLLSVSFDPQVDTPQVLRAHAQGLGADPALWSFVTGDRDAIDKWGAGFGLSVSRAVNDPRDITHNLRTVLIDRQGNLVQTYQGNQWTADQVLADLRVMVGID